MPILPTSKTFNELLGRWGGKGNPLGGLLSYVVPVVAVDRYYSPEEQNTWTIASVAAGASGEFSACGLTNTDPTVDWELLRIVVNFDVNVIATVFNHEFQVVTPLATATNPVGNNLIQGFVPGLITDQNTTLSPCRGFSGTAASIVLPLGEVYKAKGAIDSGLGAIFRFYDSIVVDFDPPMRLYGDRAVVVQQTILPFTPRAWPMTVSFRFRVRPNRIQN